MTCLGRVWTGVIAPSVRINLVKLSKPAIPIAHGGTAAWLGSTCVRHKGVKCSWQTLPFRWMNAFEKAPWKTTAEERRADASRALHLTGTSGSIADAHVILADSRTTYDQVAVTNH